ncbi:MAG: hypothetical protein ACWGSQ_11445, partial [Longimicrobiales bacterium]
MNDDPRKDTPPPADQDSHSPPSPESGSDGSSGDPTTVGRRDLLKSLAAVPVLGVFFAGWYKKKLEEDAKHEAIMAELGITEGAPAVIPEAISRPPGERIRVGIIGNGGEGESLVRSAGFAHPEWVDDARKAAGLEIADRVEVT